MLLSCALGNPPRGLKCCVDPYVCWRGTVNGWLPAVLLSNQRFFGLDQRTSHAFLQSGVRLCCIWWRWGESICICGYAANRGSARSSLRRQQSTGLLHLDRFDFMRWNHFLFRTYGLWKCMMYIRPHPIRMRPNAHRISHGLKICPPDIFLPADTAGRPFDSISSPP